MSDVPDFDIKIECASFEKLKERLIEEFSLKYDHTTGRYAINVRFVTTFPVRMFETNPSVTLIEAMKEIVEGMQIAGARAVEKIGSIHQEFKGEAQKEMH